MKRRSVGLLAAVIFSLVHTHEAAASPLLWEVTGTASGTAFTAAHTLTTVTDAPFTFAVTFDTAAPNFCGAGSSSGTYAGTAASFTVLGYRYTMSGYAESNSPLGSCFPGGGTLLRFLADSASPQAVSPNGTELELLNASSSTVVFGYAAVFLPDPAVLGALPTTLPFQPYPVGINFFTANAASFGQLRTTNATARVTAVPEPASFALLALGLSAAFRRKRVR